MSEPLDCCHYRCGTSCLTIQLTFGHLASDSGKVATGDPFGLCKPESLNL